MYTYTLLCMPRLKTRPSCTYISIPSANYFNMLATEHPFGIVYQLPSLLPPPGEATQTTRRDSTSLPVRVSNLCELLIFVKNLELSCTAQPEPQLGSKYGLSGCFVCWSSVLTVQHLRRGSDNGCCCSPFG